MNALKKVKQLRKHHKLAVFSMIFALFGCLILVVFFVLAYKYFDNRALPNTYFSHFTLGGKSQSEVEVFVDRTINVYSSEKIKVSYQGTTMEFSLSDLGIAFSVGETVDKIMLKSGKRDPVSFLKNAYITKKITPVYYINTVKLDESLTGAYGHHEKKPIDAQVVFEGGSFVTTESSQGNSIDKNAFGDVLKNSLDLLSVDNLSLTISPVDPAVSTEQAESVLEDFSVLVGDQVVLTYGYDKWFLSGKSLYDLLKVARRDQISPELIKQNGSSEVGLSLNESKMDELLNDVSEVLDKQARDATLHFEGGKVSEFSSAQDGQVLNRGEAKKLFFTQILNVNVDKNTLIVSLPVSVVKAKIANAEINKLGIKELIGSGISYYVGSIPNRMFNIELGAKMINGTLVAPGDVFSFVNLVGDVSASQGFKSAYVIKSGRTVLDDGGGICQVSTTVFRAALNSGLPIVKRTAHAYRVSYYEQKGFKPGLDATIFSPSVDLQFKNDTARHILVQTSVDRLNARLQVDIYGTSDGRRVELGEPIVSNIIPAPEPKYEDDPTLPVGTVKQVDFAVAGATSVFTRKVYKGDRLIMDDVFKSVYRPWQAVYLVGKAG